MSIDELRIMLFLEQIAPSHEVHTRTCGDGGEMASEIPVYFNIFGPQLSTFKSVGILLKYFCQAASI